MSDETSIEPQSITEPGATPAEEPAAEHAAEAIESTEPPATEALVVTESQAETDEPATPEPAPPASAPQAVAPALASQPETVVGNQEEGLEGQSSFGDVLRDYERTHTHRAAQNRLE